MSIKSTQFIKGIMGTDDVLENDIPQVAFIGRSNVGKSSVINSITNKKDLARTSKTPGRTQQINIFYINRAFYLLDLPGYGFAKIPLALKERIRKLINWYFFKSGYKQKRIILIIDAHIGPTDDDLDMLESLEKHDKHIIIVANKVDKIKKSMLKERIAELTQQFAPHMVIPYSAKKSIGVGTLTHEILRK